MVEPKKGFQLIKWSCLVFYIGLDCVVQLYNHWYVSVQCLCLTTGHGMLLQVYSVTHDAVSNCHSEKKLKALAPVISLLHAKLASASIYFVC